MLFLRVWRMQCRRVVTTPALWLTVVIFAVVLFMNSFGHMQEGSEAFLSIIYIFTIAKVQIGVLVLGVLPLLPFAMSYLQEKQEKSVRFQAVRSGVAVYAAAKYLAVLFSGFLVVVLGYALFGLALSAKLPLYILSTSAGSGGTLDLWLDAGRPVAYVTGYVYSQGLAGAFFAGLGFLFSTMTNDRFAAVMMPYLAYMFASLLGALLKTPYQYSASAWILETPFASTPTVALLLKTLAIGIALLTMGAFANLRIQRGILHE